MKLWWIQCTIVFVITVNLKLLVQSQWHRSTQINVGGLFDSTDTAEETTLKIALEQINKDKSLLEEYDLTLKAESIPEPGPSSPYYVTKSVCNLLQAGVAGVFGPTEAHSANLAQALLDRYDVPHIETKWDYRTRQNSYAINLYPHPDTLGEAFAKLVHDRGWNNFAVLFDDEDGLFKLQKVIQPVVGTKRNITVRQLPSPPYQDFKPLLKTIQRGSELTNIILDTTLERTLEVLRQAEQIGMIRFDYTYILTTLDLLPEDLEQYKESDAKFYAFRLIDPDRHDVQSISYELNAALDTSARYQASHQTTPRIHRSGLTTSQALVFDAVKLFSLALHKNLEVVKEVKSLNCKENEAWTEGSTLLNDMKAMSTFNGLTGKVQFNTSGYRTDITMDVLDLTSDGLVKAGSWEYVAFSGSRITWLPKYKTDELHANSANGDIDLDKRHLKVTTLINDPFCMHKLKEETLKDNDQYEGFSIDLVDELSKILKFNYSIRIVQNTTKPHDGVIAEVIRGEADLAVADLTITDERQAIVDFTMPFMNLGISILYVPPQIRPPSLFSFMSPFALEVWICTLVAFFGVSFVLFFVARVSPKEWDNPLPCISDPDKLYNQFKFSNSIWFTLGSIMQQGSDLAPKAVSTRIIAGIWWFFTLIMVSSYTANLATFLIVQDKDEGISGLDALAKQNKVKYGCMKSGSTSKFFSESTSSLKRGMFDNMKKWNVLKDKNQQGVDEILKVPGQYAFFMESTMIEYYIERRCGLDQMGGLLDNKGYGIALKKESLYFDKFNNAVLKLQEMGKLDELKRRWWKEQRKEKAEVCSTPSVSESVKPLQLGNVGGVFVVLVVGCFFSIFITCFEVLVKSRRLRKVEGSWWRDVIEDLQFALQCRGNVKPVVKKKSSQPSLENADEMGSTPYLKYTSNNALSET